MPQKHGCGDIRPLMQLSGTCWFNAFLTCVFYSQGMRNVMLRVMKKDGSIKGIDLDIAHQLKVLMHDMFVRGDYIEYPLLYFKPERLLTRLKDLYPQHFELIDEVVETGATPRYVRGPGSVLFRNIMDVIYPFSTLVMRYYDGTLYYSRMSNTVVGKDYKPVANVRSPIYKETKQKVPFIIVTMSTHNNNLSDPLVHNFNVHTMDTFKYNGATYVKDSMYIQSHKAENNHHVVAGVTCNNTKYVYNGWNAYSTDTAMKGTMVGSIPIMSPCPLKPMEWNTLVDDFCINLQKCDMPLVETFKQIYNRNPPLCFNTSSSLNYFFFVRKDIFDKPLSFTPPSGEPNRVRKCPRRTMESKLYRTCVPSVPNSIGIVASPANKYYTRSKTTKKIPIDEKKKKGVVKASKECPEGKDINPVTNRCVNACKDGKVRRPGTTRCINACKDGQERNPDTNRCKKAGTI